MTLLEAEFGPPPLPMPGLEPDNLLAFLALLGLLRVLETSRADWTPRASWQGPPWIAQLSLSAAADEVEIAKAANEGISSLVADFDVDSPRKNVDFAPAEYRRYARRLRSSVVGAALASALAAEWPAKKDGGLPASPLVMMFGQGHQNFLERLIDIPSGKVPNRLRKLKSPPDMTGPGNIAEALFHPWHRDDDADGFRWDPEDDQRYALRYDDPSLAGAAPTVVGANRLAAIGFLSFCTAPGEYQIKALGTVRDNREWYFVWPIWRSRLSRACVEALLNHPALLDGELNKVRHLGVVEIYRATRVANGKYMNVTRARPVASQLMRAARS
jgi:hypothetical protein